MTTALTTTPLTAELVLSALLENDGDLMAAREALSEDKENPIDKSEIVRIIADDPAALQRAYRVMAILRTGDLLDKTAIVMQSQLSLLDPADTVKAYGMLSERVESLTKAQQSNNTNVLQLVFDSMPREAAGAVKSLARMDPEKLESFRRQLRERDSGVAENTMSAIRDAAAEVDALEGVFRAE